MDSHNLLEQEAKSSDLQVQERQKTLSGPNPVHYWQTQSTKA